MCKNIIILTLLSIAQVNLIECASEGLIENPIIQTKHGQIMGSIMETRLKNQFYGFRGIPFAKPPIGDLRFQAPQPPEPWSNILSTTKDAPICPQIRRTSLNSTENIDINEDCLYLNVYTKQIFLTESTLKPVLVFIFGGGFLGGSGSSIHFAGPQYLMDQDVVLVTFNYRLGALGFMALNSSQVPGNAGMKDQVLALKWVQENIYNFGGDKNLVTVFGNSAGGASIALHLVSPMSVGLFHRAIMMSGTFITQHNEPTDNIEKSRKLATELGCSEVNHVDDIYQCLKNIRAIDIVNKYPSLLEFSVLPISMYSPVVESDFGQERFLPDKLQTLLKDGKMQKVPIIVSVTDKELAALAIILTSNDADLKTFDNEFNRVAPIALLYERDTARSLEISETIWNAYNLSHPLDKSFFPNINNLFSDGLITFGVQKFIQMVNRHTDVYYFKFAYQGRYSNLYNPEGKPYGVVHTDDLLYLLVLENVPMFQAHDQESRKVEQMTRIFSQFALYGNPIDKNDEFVGNVTWHPYTDKNHYYLDIGRQLVLKEKLLEKRIAVWEKLFQ